MFIWNDVRINLLSENEDFLSDILKYSTILEISKKKQIADETGTSAKKKTGSENQAVIKSGIAAYLGKEIDCIGKELTFSIFHYGRKMIPPVGKDSRLVRQLHGIAGREFVMSIYAAENELWYFFEDLGGIWMDFAHNQIIAEFKEGSFPFPYYHFIFFFLNPFCRIIENFEYCSLHSSCIAFGKKAVLFTGVPGSGKSTSAFALASGGGRIISDDLSLVKKSDSVYHPYILNILAKLNAQALKRFFPQFLKYELIQSQEEDIYMKTSDLSEGDPANAVLSAIIILQKSGSKDSSLAPIHPLKVVPHLFPSTINTSIEQVTKRKFEFVTGLLENIPCYQADFGTDMDDFCNKVRKVLE